MRKTLRVLGMFFVVGFSLYAQEATSRKAVAVLHPTEGQAAYGVVWFIQEGTQVTIKATVEGLDPNTAHGFHIHEFGDCSALDGTSAGGHYNPEGHAHAGPETSVRHAGDLGNIQADETGKAHYSLQIQNVTIDDDKNPILGRSIIVHAGQDDLKSQPTGDAGGRIACGVIGVAKVE